MSERTGKRRRVGIRDVAERAGVGKTTAAYILNDEKTYRFTEETCNRVRQAARELGYVPNIFAKGLKTGRSSLVGIYFDDFTAPDLVSGGGNAFFVEFFAALCTNGIESGYFPVTLFGSQNDYETNLARLDKMLQAGIGGALLYRPSTDILEFLQGRVEKDFPRVSVFSQCPDHADCLNLDVNNRDIGRRAAELLLNAGYERPALAWARLDSPLNLRHKGFLEVLEAAGKEVPEVELPPLDRIWDHDVFGNAYERGMQVIRSADADSWFCLDGIATGITTHLLQGMEVEYPEVGVVGVDLMWTTRGQRITHFTAPWDEIARRSLKLISDCIASGEPVDQNNIVLQPRFTPGATCPVEPVQA